jgi:hypothetical protein
MPIQYNPNNVFRGTKPAIDRVMAKRAPKIIAASSNVLSTAIDVVVSPNDDWQLNSVGFQFDNVAAKTFTASILNGRKIVEKYNDAIWLQANGIMQRITLTAGFYTGTELAAHLQVLLNANTFYTAAGLTFTVTYSTTTGEFVITPSSGTIRYLESVNRVLPIRDSNGGYLFGLTATSAESANVTSNVVNTGLDAEIYFVSQAASTATSYLHDTPKTLSVDQAVHVNIANGASLTASYVISYEELA